MCVAVKVFKVLQHLYLLYFKNVDRQKRDSSLLQFEESLYLHICIFEEEVSGGWALTVVGVESVDKWSEYTPVVEHWPRQWRCVTMAIPYFYFRILLQYDHFQGQKTVTVSRRRVPCDSLEGGSLNPHKSKATAGIRHLRSQIEHFVTLTTAQYPQTLLYPFIFSPLLTIR